MDCVEKFKVMQDCFREHPDVYAEGTPTARASPELPVLTIAIELDDDDPEAVTESPEAAILATEDTPLDEPPELTPTKVHTEPST